MIIATILCGIATLLIQPFIEIKRCGGKYCTSPRLSCPRRLFLLSAISCLFGVVIWPAADTLCMGSYNMSIGTSYILLIMAVVYLVLHLQHQNINKKECSF